MTAGEQLPSHEKPYSWDSEPVPPRDVLQLWTEVGNGIDKSQTVVWKSAVESLDHANNYLRSSQDARAFVEKYMERIIGILVEQQPSKIGPHERTCVQESLTIAVSIAAKDFEIQIGRNGEFVLWKTLAHVFNKKKAFYKGNKQGAWNMNNHLQGLPEVRLRMIERFRAENGFGLLQQYLIQKIGTPLFPELEYIHQILQAIGDSIPIVRSDRAGSVIAMEDDAIKVGNAVMKYITNTSDEDLKKLSMDHLSVLQHDLQRIFDRLISTRRSSTNEFYKFWRALVLKLITSKSLPLKLFGWGQAEELIQACEDHRPPPRTFIASNAGCSFVNGPYNFAGEITEDGYFRQNGEVSYVRKIPEEEGAEGGKKLTLFRCTMRSQQKWWFLSEADEEQPGTDRDIDYYQHKSKEHEEAYPPPTGWITCRTAGVDPPPTLKSEGLMVPAGQEFQTLEHQLAKWAIENEIVEQVLGDSTIHREVVARSTVLIKFLVSMCNRDQSDATERTGNTPGRYCLQASHLLFAWKTCTRKADAAVSAQVYQLLVSILPLCSSDLAIPLLTAIQTSMLESQEKRDYLFEVAEFCSALAAANLVDSKNNAATILSEDVREEVLNLLWSVLTHPDASNLKSYDILKRYVAHELSVEPKGSEHRERFLRSCIVELSTNSEKRGNSSVNEVQALRMVKLAHFVLEACPRQQADKIILDNSGALPRLLFRELTAYMERRKNGSVAMVGFQKSLAVPQSQSTASIDTDSSQHTVALNERLRILRTVYGRSDPGAGSSDPIVMTAEMLKTLWRLCDAPEDREALMVFIASASHSEGVQDKQLSPNNTVTVNQPLQQQPQNSLSAAFTDQVCQSVFLDLFCSFDFSYDQLGEGAYRSFQFLFNSVRLSPTASSESKKIALDALWRVCLTSGKASVASQAMKDLLAVYVQGTEDKRSENGQSNRAERMLAGDSNESFGERMFQCLSKVKEDLESGVREADREAERCLRILNAAIGQSDSEGSSMTRSTLARLSLLSPTCGIEDAARCLPHGMRGQNCYRRIGIVVNRPSVNSQSDQMSYQGRDDNSGPTQEVKLPTTIRFSLDVHPLETFASVKYKVSLDCQCAVTAVKPVQINGRSPGTGFRTASGEAALKFSLVPEDTVMEELGVVQGCEMVFVLNDRSQNITALPVSNTTRSSQSNDLSSVFFSSDGRFADRLFGILLGILEALPWKGLEVMSDAEVLASTDTHKLVWDLFLAMPTNASVSDSVRSALRRSVTDPPVRSDEDAMEIDIGGNWSQLLDISKFNRSVYVLLAIDAFLQPAPEALSILKTDQRIALEKSMVDEASLFRRGFIDSGGFSAVANFFSASEGDDKAKHGKTRRGNAVALRILKTCLFGNNLDSCERNDKSSTSDDDETQLLQTLPDAEGLLKSLTAMVVDDVGISSSTITDVLRFLRLLFRSPRAAQSFVSLPHSMAERFLIILLTWDEEVENARSSSSANAAIQVRKSVHDLILQTSELANNALPWLINGIDKIVISFESTSEYFDVLKELVSGDNRYNASESELSDLGTIICKKLAAFPSASNNSDLVDISTGVLCGCLELLCALIDHAGGSVLQGGVNALLLDLGVSRWSDTIGPNGSILAMMSSPFSTRQETEDLVLVNMMGVIFDGFLIPSGSSPVAICCDNKSRRRGFDVIRAAARACKNGEGYTALVNRVSGLISSTSPNIRHRWGQFGGSVDSHLRTRGASKYSGLRNQGCTCYMNSVLQQLFMMHELRDSMCSATLPASLRSSGGTVSKGAELVGKKISLQWDTGVSYDAIVEAFNETTGMHTIRYCPIQVATVGGSGHQQVQPEDIVTLSPSLPDEFVLSEGRPGKETGVYELVSETSEMEGESPVGGKESSSVEGGINETEDEVSSRHLLEEVQRTFIHLHDGSRGRCFDPRALVEACGFLKLEFDVWQQNDASEFATKLLDRLEISLKRWAPSNFRYLDHCFGLKQTKQKICKECGLKTNREEKLMNIDCQIRGKADIHEALAAMTEVEIMEGSNQVFCDNCKKNTDTILRSAISTLPNMLILSLKRFDLDYNTFETVKLNSRCEFGQTLNMKRYTLEAFEALEKSGQYQDPCEPAPMDTDESLPNNSENDDPLSTLPDEDYEYRLAGVLVHAGVAQGGHYYSFIRDRNPGSEEKWFRFDDEDVTPFDPASIESECFGGKIKKETKWPNGQVHTVEQEQFANALMLFYEKVKPTDPPTEEDERKDERIDAQVSRQAVSNGYDVFEPDVRRSNASHRWQSFLFDTEFRAFFKEILSDSRLAISQPDTALSGKNADMWRPAVIEMLLSFVFDVMLYSSDRSSLNDWTRMLEDILLVDQHSAISFVHKLARKTREVSGNWLRTYLLECPDQASRAAAVRIFSAALKSCMSSEKELRLLQDWGRTWKEQMETCNDPGGMTDELSSVPFSFERKWQALDEKQKIDVGENSALGIIISSVNIFISAVPRYWRFSAELCTFVRNLSCEIALKKSMIEAMVPARLIALVARERSPSALRVAFPGASVHPEVANTQMKAESNPSAHVMPMSGNQVLNTSDMNSSRGPSGSDYMTILEAIASLASLPGPIHADLLRDTEDMSRGRQRYCLSDNAVKALSAVFSESCAPNAPGMGQHEIEQHLHNSGVDTNQLSQKIIDMLSKHPTSNDNNSKDGPFLSLDGFLAYYRDVVQTSDVRIRQDLHTFGFRPDLSRRSRTARMFFSGDRERRRLAPESVGVDIAEIFKDQAADLGSLANDSLSCCFQMYSLAYSVSEPLFLYLVAAATYRKKTEYLINRTLQEINQTPCDWGGNEAIHCAILMLEAIAATPGDDQETRISQIMLSKTKVSRNAEHGGGLLVVARAWHRARQSQHYGNEIQWSFSRYLNIVKELRRLPAVHKWMQENRPAWGFMERDLTDSRQVVTNQSQIRGDYGSRDSENSMPLDHHTHSDSDLAAMNDSEDDDDESQFENMETFGGPNPGNEGPYQISIVGSGTSAVSGVYNQDGYFEGACRYVMEGSWNGNDYKFHIFQCNVSNNTKHWYISIVPYGGNPGTSSDIDFYTAPMTDECRLIPPTKGWVKSQEGHDPPPKLSFIDKPVEPNESPEHGPSPYV